MARLFATLRYDVCCVLHRVSQVLCLLPGLGRRPQTELHPDEAEFECKQDRRWRGEGLVFGENGVMRGEGVKHVRMKVTFGKWQKAMQCSLDFQMHSSSWNLWWQVIGVFWCIWHVLWPDPGSKEKQFITIVFPKQVTLSFSNFRSRNQVWNGIPIIWMLWKLKLFALPVTLPNCAGRSFRW